MICQKILIFIENKKDIPKYMAYKKKLLTKISPQKVDNLNCYDNNIIADISRFFQRDYQISLLGEFDFTYRNIDEINNLLDYNYIFTGDILYVPYMLSKCVGISLEHIEIREKDNLIMFIERISSYIDTEFPVGIGMDSYYLPWNPQYNILHRRHYFLIIGLDLQENIFYCLDSYLSNKIQKIPIPLVYRKFDRLILINKISKEKSYSINNIMEDIQKYLLNSGKKFSCDTIRNFSKDIMNTRFFVDQKVTGHVLENSNFLFRLTDVANSRYNFLQGLIYLKNKLNLDNLNDSLEKTYNVYKDWNILKRILVKGYISGRVTESLKRASDLLKRIADNEETLLVELDLISKI